MPATYDAKLKTDKDWVRFLSGDRDESDPRLQDEEIAALLVEEKNKYLAAFRACESILAQGQGAVSKSVGSLSLSFGDSPDSAYRTHAQHLRERGCQLLLEQTGAHSLRIL